MIGWLQGEVIHRGGGFVILDVGGVGYKVHIPNLKTQNSKLKIFIHHHVREDTQDLYGFETAPELEFFEQLLSVSGVGPKVAMVILSAADLGKLRDSIIKSDTTTLTAMPGIGRKLATKIVVELKPKLVRGSEADLAQLGIETTEVIDALVGLGYRRQEIAPVIAKLPAQLTTTQEKITWALKHLTR